MKITLLIFFSVLSSSIFGQFLFERSNFIDVYKNSSLKKLPWVGGMNFVQFSNIDLDYDGNMDLFVFDRSSNKIMTFIHSGNAGTLEYSYAPEFEWDFPELTQWVLLRDYNCDGRMDIFAYTGGGINVFKNTGNAISGLSFERMTVPYLFTIIYGNPYNLYVSGGDIPGVYDVDGDGDLDVLTFGQSGNRVEYHKNYSMEMYGVCDSLNTYELRNECWGRFTESDVTNQLNLWDTLVSPCDGTSSIVNPELTDFEFDISDVTEIIPQSRNRHVGSTVLPFDNTDDGITDLLIGDVTYNNLIYTENYGTTVNSNSGMGYQDVNFPSNTTPVDVAVFPAGFYVDINMDGTSELVVSPNYTSNSVDMESVWYYENNGTTTAPIFSFSSTELLQGDMVDVGLGAYPVFFDHDGDGLKDLIIANAYYFNKTDQANYSRLAYFKNTGTITTPEFTFVTNNYANLENTGLQLHIYPGFADIDNDGDEDMYVGDLNGGIHYYENTAGAGNPAVFAAPVLNVTDAVGTPIDVGQYSTPTFKDMDRDGLIDMVIGCKIGQLYYYKNTGTLSSPKFTFQTDNFGGVNTTASQAVYGYSVPSFVDHNGEYELFLGSFSGYLHYFTDIDANLSGSFTLVDTLYQGIRDGKQSGVAVEDLDGDGNYELFYGTKRGGLTLYESNQDLGIEDIEELEDDFSVYPNPTTNTIIVDFSKATNNFYGNNIELYNAVGQLIIQKKISSNKVQLDLNSMPEGIYILSVQIEGVRINKKIIKQ
jgi:hypothetical protein